MILNSIIPRLDGLAWRKTSLHVRNDGITENSPYENIKPIPNIPTIIAIALQNAITIASTIEPKISSTEKFRIVFIVCPVSFDELILSITTKYDGNAINNNIAVVFSLMGKING